jgi:hypothetical protein
VARRRTPLGPRHHAREAGRRCAGIGRGEPRIRPEAGAGDHAAGREAWHRRRPDAGAGRRPAPAVEDLPHDAPAAVHFEQRHVVGDSRARRVELHLGDGRVAGHVHRDHPPADFIRLRGIGRRFRDRGEPVGDRALGECAVTHRVHRPHLRMEGAVGDGGVAPADAIEVSGFDVTPDGPLVGVGVRSTGEGGDGGQRREGAVEAEGHVAFPVGDRGYGAGPRVRPIKGGKIPGGETTANRPAAVELTALKRKCGAPMPTSTSTRHTLGYSARDMAYFAAAYVPQPSNCAVQKGVSRIEGDATLRVYVPERWAATAGQRMASGARRRRCSGAPSSPASGTAAGTARTPPSPAGPPG